MKRQMTQARQIVGAGVLFLQLLTLLALPLSTAVSASTPAARPTTRTSRILFRPPAAGTPYQTTGGGTRDGGICSQSLETPQPGFTPILPHTSSAMTVSERPTFLAYIPPTTTQNVFFSVQGEDDEYSYQTTLSLPADSSIVRFTLPAEAPALEAGKTYHWSVVLICGARLRPDDPRIEGRVTRVELSAPLLNQVSQASPLEQARIYGEEGIWFDMINALVSEMYANPNNDQLTTTWKDLLAENGLEAIVSKPLVE